MMDLVEDMMKQVAQNVCGSLVVPYQATRSIWATGSA